METNKEKQDQESLRNHLSSLDDELSFEATDSSITGGLWNKLNKWYEGHKEGWHIVVNKGKNKWFGWFSFRKKY